MVPISASPRGIAIMCLSTTSCRSSLQPTTYWLKSFHTQHTVRAAITRHTWMSAAELTHLPTACSNILASLWPQLACFVWSSAPDSSDDNRTNRHVYVVSIILSSTYSWRESSSSATSKAFRLDWRILLSSRNTSCNTKPDRHKW